MSENAAMIHPFDHATALQGEPAKREGQVSPAYQNMVGPFGGISAAKVLQAVMVHPERQGSPISLTVNFLGPIAKGPVEIHPRLLRNNRSNQHWAIDLKQGDEIQCSAICVFAHRKDTWHSEEIACPEVPAPEDVKAMPDMPMLPPWVRQYDLRFITGSPFEPQVVDESSPHWVPSESLLWMADKPARAIDFPALTALSDAFFPRLFVRKRTMAPIGTVSFTVHFHVNEAELSSLESAFVLGHARASKFSGSYFDQTAELWSQDGKLLATTSQMVYYKA